MASLQIHHRDLQVHYAPSKIQTIDRCEKQR